MEMYTYIKLNFLKKRFKNTHTLYNRRFTAGQFLLELVQTGT